MAYIKSNENAGCVSFTIPLLIRILELVREDIKTDVNLHKVLEVILAESASGCLNMDHYEKIAASNPK